MRTETSTIEHIPVSRRAQRTLQFQTLSRKDARTAKLVKTMILLKSLYHHNILAFSAPLQEK
ncbi:MAG: hypothetical protein WBO73_02850 [Gammaproteobacteria bacterium]|jgi:hypothetical protein